MNTITEQNYIEAVLGGLSFVRWDRFISHRACLRFYGWIDRKDGRADFVVIDVFPQARAAILVSTSSAEKSPVITALLGNVHSPCERVESLGLKISNVIKEAK